MTELAGIDVLSAAGNDYGASARRRGVKDMMHTSRRWSGVQPAKRRAQDRVDELLGYSARSPKAAVRVDDEDYAVHRNASQQHARIDRRIAGKVMLENGQMAVCITDENTLTSLGSAASSYLPAQ